jgi:hypothetical protein
LQPPRRISPAFRISVVEHEAASRRTRGAGHVSRRGRHAAAPLPTDNPDVKDLAMLKRGSAVALLFCALAALVAATPSAIPPPARPAVSGPAAPAPKAVVVPEAHATVVVHGVNDDGKGWSLRFKQAILGAHGDGAQEVYLFRWTQPDGKAPSLYHARSSIEAMDEKYPDHPEMEAGYQVREADRLKEFLVGARALYKEYGVDGRIDVVAHSQGSLLMLKALDLGGEADNVVVLGSPLSYAGERQDDVLDALPHVRGVLYNYFTRSDAAIRFMGGGLLFREPCGWPAKGLPDGKVVQTCLDAPGHSGYLAADVIRGNFLDKLGVQQGEQHRLPAHEANVFAARWDDLVRKARLIDPE